MPDPWHDPAMERRTISLYHRIESALETIARGLKPLETVRQTAGFLVENFSEDLGLLGGRIYASEGPDYELVSTFGRVDKTKLGFHVSKDYPALWKLLEAGTHVMQRGDPELDESIEESIGSGRHFAAICVDDGNYILSFDYIEEPGARDALVATLNIVRLAINQKLREERMEALMEDAKRIQASILPRRLPQPGPFRLAARSDPADIVGGDFYDVITLDDQSFVAVIADATGHGLPAALQVRDVFMGLRMGLSREFKISRTLERLNRIIHHSRLATKFVSLFLVEVNLNGQIFYCCAGHPPALLRRASGSIEGLKTGGLLLGPLAGTRYTVAGTTMCPGDTLLLYTDGITEIQNPAQDEFGVDALKVLLSGPDFAEPEKLVEKIFTTIQHFAGPDYRQDDQSVLVIHREES